MALIKCPNCNSDISDMASKCPKCGAEIHRDENNNSSQTKKEFPKDKLIKLLIPIVCLVGLIAIVLAIKNNSLDDTEQYVSDCVKDLADREGNITVTDDIVYIVYSDSVYVTIPFDGDRAYYVDKKYLGNESEYQRIQYKNESDYNSRSEYGDVLQRKIDFAEANIAYSTAKLMNNAGGASESCRYISSEKICKKLHVSYR